MELTIEKNSDDFGLILKNKPLRTPAGNALAVPCLSLAEALVAEWQGQGEKVNKSLLALTPIACVAVDLALHNREALLADVVPYIDTDLVCYRAGDCPELLEQQAALLAPLVEWIKEQHGIILHTTTSVMPIAQPAGNQERLRNILVGFPPFKLAAFAVAVKPLGSAVLALALVERRILAEDAFRLAHLEETYETEQWGADEEKEAYQAAKKKDVLAVGQFLSLLGA